MAIAGSRGPHRQQFRGHGTPHTIQTLRPVRNSQALYRHPLTGVQSADELIAADIDADVGKGLAHGVEKYQITWTNAPGVYRGQGGRLGKRGSGNVNAGAAQYILNEPAAIESRPRIISTPLIRFANFRDRMHEHGIEYGGFRAIVVSG